MKMYVSYYHRGLSILNIYSSSFAMCQSYIDRNRLDPMWNYILALNWLSHLVRLGYSACEKLVKVILIFFMLLSSCHHKI